MIGTMIPCAGVSDGSAPNAMMNGTARLKYFTEGSFVRREGRHTRVYNLNDLGPPFLQSGY